MLLQNGSHRRPQDGEAMTDANIGTPSGKRPHYLAKKKMWMLAIF